LYFCSQSFDSSGNRVKSSKPEIIDAISDIVIDDNGKYKVKLVKVPMATAIKALINYPMPREDRLLAESFIKSERWCLDGKTQKHLVKMLSNCGFAYNHYTSTNAYEFLIGNTKNLPVSDKLFKN